ncbi:MAG: hypothetical protein QM764_04780 [Chitinophagaceae bacterium]
MTLSIAELVILFLCAVLVGITIHFFISSRRSLKISPEETDKFNRSIEEWKSKYFNDMDERDKELAELKDRVAEAEENAREYKSEAEEMIRQNRKMEEEFGEHDVMDKEFSGLKEKLSEAEENVRVYRSEALELVKQNRKLEEELAAAKKAAAAPAPVVASAPEKPGTEYIQQLRIAQSSLMEHNEKINRLLEQIDVIKEKEEQQRQMVEEKEELNNQLLKLKVALGDKEKEISTIRQKEQLTKEMNAILDNAYNEFGVLQGKIQKLETQLNQSKMLNVEYEDLKETHYKLIRDFEDQKSKLQSVSSEHQVLSQQLDETSDKLREANFQRQQLQKRVSYLEELNNDLHVVADTNKKLENQLRKIGELESMLNVVSEERDSLKKQGDFK